MGASLVSTRTPIWTVISIPPRVCGTAAASAPASAAVNIASNSESLLYMPWLLSRITPS